ncbi:NHL repeat-containing protein 3-like [Branchiostoma lanceolatum]|uniref:NHL repeat-containing protein 3-like n=1 Tax=Branchiostoma lanceolatum TaxID=7740 RepID=UPI003452920E
MSLMMKHESMRYTEDSNWPKGGCRFTGPVVSCDVLSVGTITEVFIAQRTEAEKVIVYSEDGTFLRSWNTDRLGAPHGLRVHVPSGGGVESAEVWVTDIGQGPFGCSLKMFDRHGNLKVTLGTPGERGSNLDPLQFDQVSDVTFSSTGDMFVVDGDDGINHRLLKLSADHQLLWSVGEEGAGPSQFRVPHSVDVDRYGQVWVADRRNRRIQVFSRQTGSYIGEWTLNEDVYAVRFSTDKSTVFVLEELVGDLLMLKSPNKPGFLGNYKLIDILHMPIPVIPHMFCVSQVTEAVFIAQLGAKRCQKFVRGKERSKCWLSLVIVCRGGKLCVQIVARKASTEISSMG